MNNEAQQRKEFDEIKKQQQRNLKAAQKECKSAKAKHIGLIGLVLLTGLISVSSLWGLLTIGFSSEVIFSRLVDSLLFVGTIIGWSGGWYANMQLVDPAKKQGRSARMRKEEANKLQQDYSNYTYDDYKNEKKESGSDIFKDTDLDLKEMKNNEKIIKEQKSVKNIVDLSDIVENILK